MSEVAEVPVEGTIVSKKVETHVEDDGTVVTTEETVIVENSETTIETETVEVNNVEEEKEEVKVNGEASKEDEPAAEAEAEAEPEAASAEGEAEPAVAVEGEVEAAPAEEKKEEAPPKVILHQHPPCKTLPTLSPFCIKVETFLRMNEIPYQNQYGYKAGKTGKVPWIEYKSDKVSDSSLIIDYLNTTFEVDNNKDLSDSENALGRAAQVMLEENTWWAVQHHRWIDAFNEYKKLAQPQGAGIKSNIEIKMGQRKIRSILDHHGIGRHSKDDIYAIGAKDLKALSAILGDKAYLLGETPTTFDCAVFGQLAQIVLSGLESPLTKVVNEECSNLVEYCKRVKEDFWADWDDMVLGDKPAEANLKKGFSFRKKGKGGKKAKKEEKAEEGEAEAAASGEEGEGEKAEETPAEAAVEGEAAPAEAEAAAETEEVSEEKQEEESAPIIEAPTKSEEKAEEEKPAETTETPHVNGDAKTEE